MSILLCHFMTYFKGGIMKDLSEIIKKAREKAGFSQSEIANKMGISVRTYQRFEKDPTDMNKIKQLASIIGVPYDTLLKQIKTSNKEEQETSQKPSFVEIPYYPEVFAAAGEGAYNYEVAPKKIKFSKEFLEKILELTQFSGVHLITAVGDSMTPTIENGDRLFVLPFEKENNQIREGGIYIISCTSGVLVKRVYINPFDNKMVLKSDNPSIPDIEIEGDELESCQIIGRVIGGTRRY